MSHPRCYRWGDEVVLSDYSPASSLGWLDFDAAATERVTDLIRALQEPATLDVLGLGSVRDVFSNMLHPGTTYAHTKLRYFVFLPWIFQRLERERVPPAAFFTRLRHYEARLIDCLRHLGHNQGVIGYVAGRNLIYMPSFLYWGSLWAWGIRKLPLELGEYAGLAAILGGAKPTRDDDGNVTDRTGSMWARLPEPPEGFPKGHVNFELTAEEADIIVESVRHKQPDTFLAWLCARPDIAAECLYPWDVPADDMPEKVADQLRHARCFSELTAGPQYAYNVLVARRARRRLGRDTADLENRQLEYLGKWAKMIGERRTDLRSWAGELPEFWSRPYLRHIKPGTRKFVAAIVDPAVENPGGFANDTTIHQVIRDREIRLKGSRARLGNLAALENWNGLPVGGQLEYRWSVVRRYLAEIATAKQVGV